jgi:hypothetical protein
LTGGGLPIQQKHHILHRLSGSILPYINWKGAVHSLGFPSLSGIIKQGVPSVKTQSGLKVQLLREFVLLEPVETFFDILRREL